MTTIDPGRGGDPTAQAPEGLRKLIADALTEPCQPCGATGQIVGRAGAMPCVDCLGEGRVYLPEGDMADAVLAALFEACEVREESRIVIDKPEVTGSWLPAALAGHDQRLAANWPSGRVERRFVIETPAEPVASTGEESSGD